MKNIKVYESDKYMETSFRKVDEGIYERDGEFVTSITFEQESDKGEGKDSTDISQYPLEDVLDKYNVYISDFYEDLNDGSSNICYLEISGEDLDDVKAFHEIIGKHVFNREIEENGEIVVDLVIE